MKIRTYLKKNASTILTCVGAAGVVATTVLTVKATIKLPKVLEKAEEQKGEDLTALETVLMSAPVCIPPIATGLATITCIFSANALNKRKQASLVGAMEDGQCLEWRKCIGILGLNLRMRKQSWRMVWNVLLLIFLYRHLLIIWITNSRTKQLL